jgi:hypothetical protein
VRIGKELNRRATPLKSEHLSITARRERAGVTAASIEGSMNRYLLTFASMLDALTAGRVIRDREYYASYVSIGHGEDGSPTTVALEVEAETDAEIRELLATHGITAQDVRPLVDGADVARSGSSR